MMKKMTKINKLAEEVLNTIGLDHEQNIIAEYQNGSAAQEHYKEEPDCSYCALIRHAQETLSKRSA